MSARAVRSAEYDGVAKALHWLVLALLAAQYLVAWTMPEIHRDSRPDRLVSLHVSIGLLILAIVVVRLIWRLRHPVVLIADKTPGWQRAAAQIVHGLLYVLLIALPLMGWRTSRLAAGGSVSSISSRYRRSCQPVRRWVMNSAISTSSLHMPCLPSSGCTWRQRSIIISGNATACCCACSPEATDA